MKTELVNLSQIELNAANPRTINKDKFDKLINSLLALPKMLDLRPIVVDNTMVALGGNMRYRALSAIADMSEDELRERLSGIRDFQKKTQAEQDNLVEYWLRWKDKPTAPVIKASELTDAEQREFIIKDNVGFGEWDMDALANEWDNDDLVDWGVDVWQEDGAGESSGGGEMQGGSEAKTTLNDRFVVPPFSILDTRKGYWQARKKMWRELIGDMGESRSDTLHPKSSTKTCIRKPVSTGRNSVCRSKNTSTSTCRRKSSNGRRKRCYHKAFHCSTPCCLKSAASGSRRETVRRYSTASPEIRKRDLYSACADTVSRA